MCTHTIINEDERKEKMVSILSKGVGPFRIRALPEPFRQSQLSEYRTRGFRASTVAITHMYLPIGGDELAQSRSERQQNAFLGGVGELATTATHRPSRTSSYPEQLTGGGSAGKWTTTAMTTTHLPSGS